MLAGRAVQLNIILPSGYLSVLWELIYLCNFPFRFPLQFLYLQVTWLHTSGSYIICVIASKHQIFEFLAQHRICSTQEISEQAMQSGESNRAKCPYQCPLIGLLMGPVEQLTCRLWSSLSILQSHFHKFQMNSNVELFSYFTYLCWQQ